MSPSKVIDKAVSDAFERLGFSLARRPFYWILGCVVMIAVLAPGMAFQTSENDPLELYTPDGSIAGVQDKEMEDLFPLESPTRSVSLYVFAADDGNILRRDVLEQVAALNSAILAARVDVEEEDSKLAFGDVCYRQTVSSPCADAGLLAVTDWNVTAFLERQLAFDGGVVFDNGTRSVQIADLLSEAAGDENGVLNFGRALVLTYAGENSDRTYRWEAPFVLEALRLAEEQPLLRVAAWNGRALEDALDEATVGDITLLVVMFVLMTTFVNLANSSNDAVRSRPLLASAGVASAGLAVLCSFGIMGWLQVPYVALVGITPFLVVGIGVDDMFILMGAFARTNPEDSLQVRLGQTMRDSGVAVTITSLTDFLGFVAGATTPFKAVRYFCFYTGTAILMDFILQMTLFGALLALNARREAAGKHNLLPCRRATDRAAAKADGRSGCYIVCCTTTPADPAAETGVARWMRTVYGPGLMKPTSKVAVLLGWLLYLSVGIYGVTQLQEGLDLRNLAPDGHFVIPALDAQDAIYINQSTPLFLVVPGSAPYWQQSVRDNFRQFGQELNDNDMFVNSSWISWLEAMEQYTTAIGAPFPDSEDAFETTLDAFISGPGEDFDAFVSWKEVDGEWKVNGTRFFVEMKPVQGTQARGRAMNAVRDFVADKKPVKQLYPHTYNFVIWEQFVAVLPNTLATIAVAAVAMVLVSMTMLTHIMAPLLLLLSIASIDTGLFGFMALWGLPLDTITMVLVVMSIGFSVDFAAHIFHGYLSSSSRDREERAVHALAHLGAPILQGGMTTLLGSLVVAGAASYIFRAFFRTMLLTMLFGLAHGLIVLPVVLSIIGPRGSGKKSSRSVSPAGGVEMAPKSMH